MISVVLTEVRKGASKRAGGDMQAVLGSLAAAIVGPLGVAIRARVRDRADLAGQPVKSWDTRYKNVLVSGRYPGASGKGQTTKSGAIRFHDSQTMHEALGARRGSYSVSGGMWDGLTRIVITPTLVTLQFRGRSEGQEARIKNGKQRPLRVNNALKAATVLQQHGVNLLALNETELAAIGLGCISSIALGINNVLEVEWQGQRISGDSVDTILRRAFGVSGASIPTGGV